MSFRKLLARLSRKADKERETPRHTMNHLVIGDLVEVQLFPTISSRPSMRGVPLELKGVVTRVVPDENMSLEYFTREAGPREVVILVDEISAIQLRNGAK